MDRSRSQPPPQLVVVTGPPGAGKGTQCSRSAGRRVLHLSTGDALRQAIQARTPLGERVADQMASGGLAPDEVVLEVVTRAISALAPETVVLLDGFPRTVTQAQALLDALEAPPALVLELTASVDVLRDRLARRVVCTRCGRSGAHKRSHPNLRAVCPCGGMMEPRTDDAPEQLERRLRIFEDEHRAVIARLGRAGSAHVVVDGGMPADVVAARFAALIAEHTDGASAAARDQTTSSVR